MSSSVDFDLADLAKRYGARAVAVRLLHAARRRRGLARSLCVQQGLITDRYRAEERRRAARGLGCSPPAWRRSESTATPTRWVGGQDRHRPHPRAEGARTSRARRAHAPRSRPPLPPPTHLRRELLARGLAARGLARRLRRARHLGRRRGSSNLAVGEEASVLGRFPRCSVPVGRAARERRGGPPPASPRAHARPPRARTRARARARRAPPAPAPFSSLARVARFRHWPMFHPVEKWSYAFWPHSSFKIVDTKLCFFE